MSAHLSGRRRKKKIVNNKEKKKGGRIIGLLVHNDTNRLIVKCAIQVWVRLLRENMRHWVAQGIHTCMM